VNEITIQGEIKSKNVVEIYNAAKSSESFWILMELCNGGDLDTYRKLRGGYLIEPEARLVLR